MKKLITISPFLLLSFPVFVVTLFTFASHTLSTNNEVALKAPAVKVAGVKINDPFYK